MAAKSSFAIGIDLGTTYCCVAVRRDQSQKPEVIQNDMGNNTTPSYVSFNIDKDADEDEDVFAGDAAKDEAYENPENTVFDIKRLIGRTFDDAHVQQYKHLWPFHLTEIHGLVAVKIGHKEILPQAVSIRLISHLKKIAEDYLDCTIDSAVVTVPVYYNELQQSVTRASCVKAGFKSVEFILEPVAAAIAYGLGSSIKNKGAAKTCLIFDLGGGTFDVTIFTLNAEKQVTIEATGGDDRLGGEDFNDILTEHCLQQFKKQHGIDLTEGKESEDDELRKKVARRFRRIRKECERQKCFLTSTTEVVISLDGLIPDTPMAVPVSRKLFEDLIAGHLKTCITIVGRVLKNAGLTKGDIDDVVVVGGSARIPKVQALLSDYFEGKRLHMSVDADEAVAIGAAVHACNTFHGKSSASGVTLVQQMKLNRGTGYEKTPIREKSILKSELSTPLSTMPHHLFNRVTKVLDSLSFSNYKSKFMDNELSDAILEDCVSDGSLNSFLSDIIPVVGHRIQFVKAFSKQITESPSTRGDIKETPNASVDDELKLKVSTPKVSRHNASCDGCRARDSSSSGHLIIGPRYKCLQCPNYDLCKPCVKKKVHSHQLFVKILDQEMYTQRLRGIMKSVATSKSINSILLDSSSIHYYAQCDACSTIILSSTYRCIQCLDLDLCKICMKTQMHSHHSFLKIPPEMVIRQLKELLMSVAVEQSIQTSNPYSLTLTVQPPLRWLPK